MTRKHFEAIAEALSESKGQDWEQVVERVADSLRQFNPNFDKGRFIDACRQ